MNVQHDCCMADCPSTGTRAVIQERQETQRTIKVVKHKNDGRFIVNMHALHNANIIHKLFPQEMYSLPPVSINCQELHHSLAAWLHEAKKTKGKQIEGARGGKESEARPEETISHQEDYGLGNDELADSIAAAQVIVDLENAQ